MSLPTFTDYMLMDAQELAAAYKATFEDTTNNLTVPDWGERLAFIQAMCDMREAEQRFSQAENMLEAANQKVGKLLRERTEIERAIARGEF